MNDLTPVRISGRGVRALSTAKGSDKTITVPTRRTYWVYSIVVDLQASATVGDRVLRVQHKNAVGDILYQGPTVPVCAANQNETLYLGVGETYSIEKRRGIVNQSPSNSMSMGIPMLRMEAGDVLRMYDAAAIDAANDAVRYAVSYWEQVL